MTARSFQTIDPATGGKGKAYPGHSREQALAMAKAARTAFLDWRQTPFADRGRLMKRVGALLGERREDLCALMTAEMGKTLAEGRAEIDKCAGACDHFADHAAQALERIQVDLGEGQKAFVAFNPLGVILAVMPWNFPFWQVFRFAAPQLMAGNGAVLKHASSVPGCALAIEAIFRDAGFPPDLFRTALIPSDDVEALIACDHIAAVTLTGSVEAGRKVAAAAGAALKKCVLELGGSDAYLVLEDADIAKAAQISATARMVNGGQSCIAGKRFIVVDSVKPAFEQALAAEMAKFEIGDPGQETTRLGPMHSVEGRDDLHDQVRRSLAAGARLLTGGEIPDRPGAWYPATVLTDVTPDMPAGSEETFGPVAAVIAARDQAEAVAIANASPFGLGGGVITSNLSRGEAIAADQLESGMAFVNANVRSDARLPFGGIKHSGYGRECAPFGLREFQNVKSVVVKV